MCADENESAFQIGQVNPGVSEGKQPSRRLCHVNGSLFYDESLPQEKKDRNRADRNGLQTRSRNTRHIWGAARFKRKTPGFCSARAHGFLGRFRRARPVKIEPV